VRAALLEMLRERMAPHGIGFISYNGNIEVNSSLLTAILYDKPEIKREP
jgi:hypothetical protein